MKTDHSDCFHLKCPACGTGLKAPKTMAGRRTKCPKCDTPLVVPGSASTSGTPPPLPSVAEPPRDAGITDRPLEQPPESRHRSRRIRFAATLLGGFCVASILGFVLISAWSDRAGSPDDGGMSASRAEPPVQVSPELLALSAVELLEKAKACADDRGLTLDVARAFVAREEYATAADLLKSRSELLRRDCRETGELCYVTSRHILRRWLNPEGHCLVSASCREPWLYGVLAARKLVAVAEELEIEPEDEHDELVRLVAYYYNNEDRMAEGCQDFLDRHPDSEWAPGLMIWLAQHLDYQEQNKSRASQLYDRVVADYPDFPMAPLALLNRGKFERLFSEYPESPYAPAAFYRFHDLEGIHDGRSGLLAEGAGERFVALQTVLEDYPQSTMRCLAEEQLFGHLFEVCGSKWTRVKRADLEVLAQMKPDSEAGRIAARILKISESREVPTGLDRMTEEDLLEAFRPGTHGALHVKEWIKTGDFPDSFRQTLQKQEQSHRELLGQTIWPVMPEVAKQILEASQDSLWAPGRLAQLPRFSRPEIEAVFDFESVWTPSHRVQAAEKPSGKPYFAMVKHEGAEYVRSPLGADRPLVIKGSADRNTRLMGFCQGQQTGMYPAFKASVSLSIKADFVEPFGPGNAIFVDLVVGTTGATMSKAPGIYRNLVAIDKDIQWTRVRKTFDVCLPRAEERRWIPYITVTAPNCFGRVLIDDVVVVYGDRPRGMDETLSEQEIEDSFFRSAHSGPGGPSSKESRSPGSRPPFRAPSPRKPVP